jgi:hypothetical protein
MGIHGGDGQEAAMRDVDLRRRRCLRGFGALAAASVARPVIGAPVACHDVTPPTPKDCAHGSLSPGSLAQPGTWAPMGTPIRIDAHCHVFNAQDIPTKNFLTRVMVHNAGDIGFVPELLKRLGPLIARIANSITPTSCGELEYLGRRTRVSFEDENECQIHRFANEFQRAVQPDTDFRVAFQQQLKLYNDFRSRANRSPIEPSGDLFEPASIVRLISAFQNFSPTITHEDKDRRALWTYLSKAGRQEANGNPFDLLMFAFHATSPRFRNLWEMQKLYQRDPATSIDVFCPAMLDFGYWLDDGSQNLRRQADGIHLMEQLAIAFNGAFLPLVAYNPRADIGRRRAEALARVIEAVEHRGFIGIKLYPPIRVDPGLSLRDHGSTCPPNTKEIDAVLTDLYKWARAKGVPILAHASHSIGESDEKEDCAGPSRWALGLGVKPGLPVQAAHFGGNDDQAQQWAGQFAELMGDGQGLNLRADLSNQDALFYDKPTIERFKRALRTPVKPKGIAADRTFYGSDFFMTDMAGATRLFAIEMARFLDHVEDGDSAVAGLRDRVFGSNAADFYGLRSNTDCTNDRTTRCRLTEFYERSGVPTPHWMCRLDGKC